MVTKRFTAERRREQIANVAARLFSKRGFSGVTTREIAKGAKVSEAMVFRHFPTKDALYKEIIRQKVKVLPGSFDIAAAEKGDDREVFKSIAAMFFEHMEKDSTFLRLMLYSALEDKRLANAFIESRENFLFEFLLNYVGRRIKAGGFKKNKPAIIVRAFVGMFFHYIMSSKLFREPENLKMKKEDAINGFVDIFLSGVKA